MRKVINNLICDHTFKYNENSLSWHWTYSQIRELAGAHNRPLFFFFFWSGYMMEAKPVWHIQIHELISSDSGMSYISLWVSKAYPSFMISPSLPEKAPPFAHPFSVASELLLYLCYMQLSPYLYVVLFCDLFGGY